MPSATTIFAVVAIFVLMLVGIFVFLTPKSSKSTTTTATVTTNNGGGTNLTQIVSSTTTIAKIQYYGINQEYIYDGPYKMANQTCLYASRTDLMAGGQTVNGSSNFTIIMTPQSWSCNLTITNIQMVTQGFNITSTEPKLPLRLPVLSESYLQLNVKAPNTNFYGPLTVRIYET